MPTDPVMHKIVLRNPMRYLVPFGTALTATVLFLVPIAIAGAPDRKALFGSLVLVALVAWMLRSGWRAPFAAAIDSDGVLVRRWSGQRHYAVCNVSRWWFAVPDGPPTQSPPATNGVLYLAFADKTRFRAEVTADEAERVSVILVGATLASPAAV